MSELILMGDDEGDSQHIHRVEQNSGVVPGTFWRCLVPVDGVDADYEKNSFSFRESSIYLLTAHRFFDGKLHSIILLNDPAHGKGKGLITIPIFLQHFEWVSEEDAKAFRDSKVALIMNRTAEIQKEMAEAMANPALLGAVVEKGLAEWEAEIARRNQRDDDEEDDEPREHLPAVSRSLNGRFDLTAAVSNRIHSTDVAVFTHMAKREGKIAEIRGKWMQDKVSAMTRVMEKLPPFYAEHSALGLARVADQISMANDIEKGLRSLRLYTGDGVQFEKIMTGESAPYEEPLTVFQRKLFMDEEVAAYIDVDEMFDFHNEAEFFKLLRENDDFKKLILPAQRGVVAMATRRNDVNYDVKSISDAMEAIGKNKLNKALFLLVRDGENWYRVFSDEPSHELSPRLFPTRAEMGELFNGVDGETIGFEDLRFTNRTNEFDLKSLSYKRFLILACGLDHREKLFGRFYPDDQMINFISMDFQSKYMKFIRDDDADVMLGDNVGSVYGFIKDNHSQLAAGSRVLVFANGALQQEAAPGAFDKGFMARGSYEKHYARLVDGRWPAVTLTVRQWKDDLVVDFPVTRRHSHRGYARPDFNVRINLNKLTGSKLGYLVLDTISTDQLRPFVWNRRSRASHLEYIHGFKHAVRVLAVREDANMACLNAVKELATNVYKLTEDQANKASVAVIQAYRVANPNAEDLPRPHSAEFREMADELPGIVHAFKSALQRVDDHIRSLGGTTIRVMRGKRGVLIAYYEQPASERDIRIPNWKWVGRRTFTPGGKPSSNEFEIVHMIEGRIVGENELELLSPELSKKYVKARTDLKILDLVRIRMDLAENVMQAMAGAFKGRHMGISDRAWLLLTSGKESIEQIERNHSVGIPMGVDAEYGKVFELKFDIRFVLDYYGDEKQRAMVAQWSKEKPRKKKRKANAEPVKIPQIGIDMNRYWHAGTDSVLNYSFGSRDYYNVCYWVDGKYLAVNDAIELFLNSVEREKKKDDWGSSSYLDPATVWFPPEVYGDDGKIDVARFFPDYPTEIVVEEPDEDEVDEEVNLEDE